MDEPSSHTEKWLEAGRVEAPLALAARRLGGCHCRRGCWQRGI